jgi:hypothetical protein
MLTVCGIFCDLSLSVISIINIGSPEAVLRLGVRSSIAVALVTLNPIERE